MKINHKDVKSFFIGTLLGDSYIHNNVFYCKQISQDLINFKAWYISKCLPDAKINIKEYPSKIDKNGVHHQKYWTLSVSKSVYIKKLYKLFYPNGKKIYPSNLIKNLSLIGFAMWYADDGTTILVGKNSHKNIKSRRVQLCTDSFTYDEHIQIISELKYHNLYGKILKRNLLYRLQLNTTYQDFIVSISDYFYKYFPSLLYKMDLGYRNETLNSIHVSDKYKKCYFKISAHPLFYDRLKDDIV